MSMRGQEATSSEGSPMTKPKPMILAKARPVNLASHSPSSESENPPQDLRDPVNPENVDERQGSQTSTRKHAQTATPRTEFQNMKYTNHQYMTKVFQFLQKKLGITAEHSTFSMGALKTDVLTWRMFMSSSMKAAIYLGPNYLANLEIYKNTNFEVFQSLFHVTQKFILEHSEEILNVHTIETASPSWTRSVLAHEQVIQWTKAKVRVFSDSVLCLVKDD